LLPEPALAQGEVCNVQAILIYLVFPVLADIMVHLVCKWLDGRKQATPAQQGLCRNPAQFTFYNLRTVSPTLAHR
jgi:hypothetical protein